MKDQQLYIVLAIAIVVLAGGIALWGQLSTSPSQPAVNTVPAASTTPTTPTSVRSTTGTHVSSYTGKTTVVTTPPANNPVTPYNGSVNVNYTTSGFSPKVLTIRKDTTVNFVNTTNTSMWVASDPYPTNEGYSGTTATQHCPDAGDTHFDECTAVGKGNTFTFVFLKVGTWTYHDQQHPENTGTIIVTN